MNKGKTICAFLLAILGWVGGVAIGVVWAYLENGGEAIQGNYIDIEALIIQEILPALVSVFLSNWILRRLLPDSENRKNYILIFNIATIFAYGGVFFADLSLSKYGNLLYSIIGVILAGYHIKKYYIDE